MREIFYIVCLIKRNFWNVLSFAMSEVYFRTILLSIEKNFIDTFFLIYTSLYK